MGLGNWNVKVSTSTMPQKVATAVSALGETLLGAEYEPIAYLGSQTVNGINHAVLAEQTIVAGRDTQNVVLLVFNEKPNQNEVSLVGIERVVEGGLPLGGTQINVQTELNDEAAEVWNDAFCDFVGSNVQAFAQLGTQVVNGVNYIYAATVTPVVPNAAARVVIVTINRASREVVFTDLLENKQEAALGYAFTWLKNTH